MGQRILIVDDSPELGESLQIFLSRQGFDVAVALNGAEARSLLDRRDADLILLDVNLPDESGFDIARDVRRVSSVPIIMLTGRKDEVDRIVGLDLGADDYVAKPFSAGELAARIRAVLRRAETVAGGAKQDSPEKKVACFDGWRMDLARRRLLAPDGREIRLTAGEFELLLTLVKHPLQVRTREQLLAATGEDTAEAFDRAIDTRITRLRNKIEPDPKNPTFIRTERGVGYVFSHKVEWR
ncbi:MAG: response regulator transcription factor [Rhodospirillales bacterium]|jgi:two-component system phosphate regulon response regulator OmpR|nr:response regulator transcription factor [Rhodospirillales bacterium]